MAVHPTCADRQNTPADSRPKSPGAYIATGSRDKSIRIWDSTTGQCLRTFTGHDNWVRSLIFHPSGKYLLSASDDKTIRVWDLAQGRCTKTIEAHGHFVTCMAWGRAGVGGSAASEGKKEGANGTAGEVRRVNVIATGSVDQTVKVSLQLHLVSDIMIAYLRYSSSELSLMHRYGHPDYYPTVWSAIIMLQNTLHHAYPVLVGQ